MPDLNRRKYDVLRLVDQHGPIGSIQLVELMQQRGYSIKDRTIRMTLSELDDAGLTIKVPGRGRTLTDAGSRELRHGDVGGRLERVRTHIATLTSRVSYDPIEDAGALVASSATVLKANLADSLAYLQRLAEEPFGPLPVSVREAPGSEGEAYQILVPSSITLDGVLLAHGINADLQSAGIIEYEPTEPDADTDPDVDTDPNTGFGNAGGRIHRYVDVISGEGSSIDVVALLIEAGRTDVGSIVDGGGHGLLVADDRTFPLNRLEETRDLTLATRSALGGVVAIERPRGDHQFGASDLPWGFGSITYAGSGELVLCALAERGLTESWSTLHGIADRTAFEPVHAIHAEEILGTRPDEVSVDDE